VEEGYTIFVDINSFRNRLIHWGLPIQALPAGHSVYDDFELIFGKSLYVRELINSAVGPIILFPYGSKRSRWMSNTTIKKIIDEGASQGLQIQVCLHESEIKRVKDVSFKVIEYSTFPELFTHISRASVVISIDSLPFHLSLFLNTKVFILTNSHKLFIPENLFNLGSVFELNPSSASIHKLIKNISNFLSNDN
jgi:hypothetical protein